MLPGRIIGIDLDFRGRCCGGGGGGGAGLRGRRTRAYGRLSYEIREQNEEEAGNVSKYCRDFYASIFFRALSLYLSIYLSVCLFLVLFFGGGN